VRARPGPELTFVLANQVRMDQLPIASAGLQRSRRVAALPPLPPEPYELRTTFPSNPVALKREYLLVPYYALFFSTIFLLSPVWVPLGVIIECLVKVGLWPYVERLLRYLVLSPTLSAAQITSRLLGYCYSAAIRLSRGCIRIALRTPRYIVKSTSLAIALVLLPSRTLLRSVHRTTRLASVLLSPVSCPVECDKASCSCSLVHSRDAMAGFGKKLFYGIVTLLIGLFAVFPLIAFAAVTFSLAIVWLSLMILFKGGGVIRRGVTHWWQGDDRNSPAAIAERNRTAAIAKREARSRSESFSQSSASSFTPRSQSNRSNRSGSNVSLVSLPQNAPQIDRDYEGMYSSPISGCFDGTNHTRSRRLADSKRQQRPQLKCHHR
jgi:hypothetical protein